MKRIKSVALWILSFSVGFAFAATPAFADSLDAAAQAFGDAVTSGHYTVAAVLVVVLAVAAVRKLAAGRWPFLAGDIGGSLLVLIAAFGTTLASSLNAGAALTLGTVFAAFKLAAAASGGYSLVRRLGRALIGKVPLPGWAKSLLSSLLWLFRDRAAEDAKKAGDDAVEAHPALGVGDTAELD